MENIATSEGTAGVLYLLGFAAGLLSVAHTVDDADYLSNSAIQANGVKKAIFFQILLGVCYLGVAIVLYPLLKVHHEMLAAGFLGFRLVAVVFLIMGAGVLHRILNLSREYVKVGTPDFFYFQEKGFLLKRSRDMLNHVGMVIALCVGGILLYTITLQSELIPAWLSIWGLLGSSIAIIASLLVLLKYIDVLKPQYILLNLPIAMQEIVFALWLIVME